MKSSRSLIRWNRPNNARAAHCLTTSTVKLVITLLILGASGSAIAQPDMDALLQRKYDIMQQQADSERMRAEAEIKRNRNQSDRSSTSHSSSGSQRYVVPTGIDSLFETNAATYRLGNGVILRASGIFWPDAPTVCIANCPQAE